jgi:hypothetical protein
VVWCMQAHVDNDYNWGPDPQKVLKLGAVLGQGYITRALLCAHSPPHTQHDTRNTTHALMTRHARNRAYGQVLEAQYISTNYVHTAFPITIIYLYILCFIFSSHARVCRASCVVRRVCRVCGRHS